MVRTGNTEISLDPHNTVLRVLSLMLCTVLRLSVHTVTNGGHNDTNCNIKWFNSCCNLMANISTLTAANGSYSPKTYFNSM